MTTTNPFKPVYYVSALDPAVDKAKSDLVKYGDTYDVKHLVFRDEGPQPTVFEITAADPNYLATTVKPLDVVPSRLTRACVLSMVHKVTLPDGDVWESGALPNPKAFNQPIADEAWFTKVFDEVGDDILHDVGAAAFLVSKLAKKYRPTSPSPRG